MYNMIVRQGSIGEKEFSWRKYFCLYVRQEKKLLLLFFYKKEGKLKKGVYVVFVVS